MLPRRTLLFVSTFVIVAFLVAYAYLNESFGGSLSKLTLTGSGGPLYQSSSRNHDLHPCLGAEGPIVAKSWDDDASTGPYPEPLWGSYDALNLPKTWVTAQGRYGPYGFHHSEEGSDSGGIDWNGVDWAQLQNQCMRQNRRSLPLAKDITPKTRLRPPKQGLALKVKDSLWAPISRSTGQTAIVLRTWDSYDYTQEDVIHIRSLVTEAALGSSGRYAVFILVDVKDEGRRERMRGKLEDYESVLVDVVPNEFRNMAVLFDETLLESWYPKTKDHRAEFQMYQGLELFANAFRFDHYWQLEMDVRFIVNARHYLDALSDFAYQEPRKQALARATYRYMPALYRRYETFMHAVDYGQSSLPSDPYAIPTIPSIPYPAGPTPPSPGSKEDNFEWGCNEDADVILTNTVVNTLNITNWPYEGYATNFEDIDVWNLPRLQSPVSITRTSRHLLQLIHNHQTDLGLALPSEATAPSFAWYHRLKISYPPSPFFQRNPHPPLREMEDLFNGGPVEDAAKGDALYNPRDHWDIANAGTWHWGGTWPREIMDVWMGLKTIEDVKSAEWPWILRRDEEGKVWAPGVVALHPVKTNGVVWSDDETNFT